MVRRIACVVLLFGMEIPFVAQQTPPQSDEAKAPVSVAPPPSADKAKHAGGKVNSPVLIHAVDPSFTQEALDHGISSGMVLVSLVIDEHGMPQNVQAVKGKGLGMGLDEEAVKSVQQYRFKPAMQGGVPVKCSMNIEVRFDRF